MVSPPSLPPELKTIYVNLSIENQNIFNKVFLWVWRYIFNLRAFVKRSNGVVMFWAFNDLREKADLTASQLSVLSFIYYFSGCGRDILHSDRVYNGPLLPNDLMQSKQHIIYDLIQKGYLTRSTRDISAPYLSRSVSRHPVFISLTRAGVQVIEGIEKDLYKVLLNTSYNELTGINKKS